MQKNERLILIENRMRSLAKAWGRLLYGKNPLAYKELFILNNAIATRVIKYYVRDLDFLKIRYGIPDRVQTPKIAGLVANAILKYRPLVPKDGKQEGIENNEINEFLAIYYGICICAKYEENGERLMAELILKDSFYEWFKRFMFLLRERNYTSESIVMVFETLCLAAFPDSLNEKSQMI